MIWKARYWGRLSTEKLLCALRMDGLHELIKKATGRKSSVSKRFVLERVERKLTILNRLISERPIRVVHEQGTGWHGIDLVIFYLLGLRVHTTDVRRLLNYSLIKMIVQVLVDNAERFPEYENRIHELADWRSLSLEAFLDRADITYYVDEKFTFPNVRDVDLFYSDSVLQRMKRADLQRYVESSVTAGSKSSRHHHRVDCNDFFSIRRKAIIPALYYLTIPEPLWEAITAKKMNYQNRMRMPEFLQMFEQAGWSTHTRGETSSEDYVDYVREHREKIPTTKKYSIEQVAIAHFVLEAQTKESGVAPSLNDDN